MQTTGLIVAMTSEFEFVSQILHNKKESYCGSFRFVQGELSGRSVVLMKCGIGKVCAALGTAEMIKNFAPAEIINTGIAGGIDTKTKVMDMVAGSEVVYHDVWCGDGNEYGQVQEFPARYKADEKLLKLALSVGAGINIYGGLICSGDKFITDKEELRQIKGKFAEGLAVDMESAAIAQTCHIYNVPFLSLRIISDTPGADNHAEQYANFWQKAPENSLNVIKKLIEKLA